MNAIGRRLAQDAIERLHLLRAGGHNQFAQLTMRDTPLGAIGVQHLFALHTQTRFERTCGVINARVDDFAVACAGASADRILRFKHHDLVPRQSQRPRNSQAHHTSANHDCIDLFHLDLKMVFENAIVAQPIHPHSVRADARKTDSCSAAVQTADHTN